MNMSESNRLLLGCVLFISLDKMQCLYELTPNTKFVQSGLG